jgi:hypothetical protein
MPVMPTKPLKRRAASADTAFTSPLRGSNLAKGLIGSLAAMIIREATISTQASQEMVRLTAIEKAELKPMRRSNSVDSLSPKSRFLNAMNTIPITPGVPYDTIIGDRGRGDSPNSSDGVVPYWSSHMNGAESGRAATAHPLLLDFQPKMFRTSGSNYQKLYKDLERIANG